VQPDPSCRLEEARRLDAAGNHAEALAAFSEFLEVHPDSTEGWVDYAGLLMVLGKLEEAGDACARALRIEPRHYGALVHSACVKMHLGYLDASEVLFRDAITLEPGRIAGHLMFSDCLVRKGDLDEARGQLEKVLELAPGNTIALDRRNTLMVLQGDWPGLRKDMERQLVRYTGPEAEYVASHLDLLFGDMPRGWQRFESRLDIPDRLPSQRSFTQPRWRGEPFPGQTLLLSWEQGYGDTLMFLRFVPLAKALGGRVVVEIQPPLAELAATCAGVDAVVAAGHPLPPFDLHASLLSLPALAGTRLESIPGSVPYLEIPGAVPARDDIARILEASTGRVRIGICWAGNRKHPRDAKRSISPAALAPLGELPHVAWHSFQFEAAEEPPLPGIVALGSLLKGFPNTAFALSGMDLVITVDTVLAHLAGALGIPTFLLLSFIPDWRWMLGRDDSPWYPTLHIYRQSAPGNWDSVIAQVVRDLGESE
jgi:hypothetical protein